MLKCELEFWCRYNTILNQLQPQVDKELHVHVHLTSWQEPSFLHVHVAIVLIIDIYTIADYSTYSLPFSRESFFVKENSKKWYQYW